MIDTGSVFRQKYDIAVQHVHQATGRSGVADQGSPFGTSDFSRIFTDAGIPGADIEAVLASHKRNVEALVSAGQVVAEGYQAAARRQMETLHSAAGAARSQFGPGAFDGDAMTHLERQATLLQSEMKQAIETLQESVKLVQKSQVEALDILGRRTSEGIDEIRDKVRS